MYGLGADRRGKFGHLFTSKENRTDYSVERLSEAGATLVIPDFVEKLLIPDPRLQERLQGVLALRYETLDTGALVATANVPDRPIVFLGATGIPGFALSKASSEPEPAALLAAPGTCDVSEDESTVFEGPPSKHLLTVC